MHYLGHTIHWYTHIVYVITPYGVVLQVYPPKGWGANKLQQHDKRRDKMFITVDWSLRPRASKSQKALSLSQKGKGKPVERFSLWILIPTNLQINLCLRNVSNLLDLE